MKRIPKTDTVPATHTAYVLLRESYADWEAASAVAELQRSFGFQVRTVGLTRKPIRSMGGMKVVPDLPVSEMDVDSAAILILPGGELWKQGEVPEVSSLLKTMLKKSRPIAAICAATLALAYAGVLDHYTHTSNGRDFIESFVPQYRGQHLYRATHATMDRLVITANGLSPFAFAAAIFRKLAPQRQQDIDTYEELYSRGLMD